MTFHHVIQRFVVVPSQRLDNYFRIAVKAPLHVVLHAVLLQKWSYTRQVCEDDLVEQITGLRSEADDARS